MSASAGLTQAMADTFLTDICRTYLVQKWSIERHHRAYIDRFYLNSCVVNRTVVSRKPFTEQCYFFLIIKVFSKIVLRNKAILCIEKLDKERRIVKARKIYFIYIYICIYVFLSLLSVCKMQVPPKAQNS